MRLLVLSLPVLIAAAGCATGPSAQNSRYAADLEALTRECEARDGIVTPTSRTTGQARADHTCRINTATRIEP